MRLFFPGFLLLALSVFAQNAQQQMPQIITITPDTVVAIINGQKFTAGDLERLTLSLSAQSRALAGTQPKAFLEQYAYTLTLASEAEKAKLHEASPYRQRIQDARNQILVQAIISEQNAQAKASLEDVKKEFATHPEDYRQAHVKVIFVSRISQITNLGDGKVKNFTPEEIKEKVALIGKKVKEGADFVKLAEEYSDDRNTADKGADLPYPIRANAATFPLEMRTALLKAKPGEVVGPLEHSTGYYFFRVESIDSPTFDAVKADIEKDLKAAQVRKWMDQMKAKSSVTLENDAFWSTFLAANQMQEVQPVPKPDASKPPEPAPKIAPGPKGGK